MAQLDIGWPVPPNGLPAGPLPSQGKFLHNDAKYRAYVGGFRAGKSVTLCYWALMESLLYGRNRGMLGRLTYQRLRDSTMRTFFDLCPEDSPLIYDFNREDMRVTLINGSEIYFRHLDSHMGMRGVELGWFGIDEASEIPEFVFDQLGGRLSRADSSRRGVIVSNVAGHNWIWRRFFGEPGPDYWGTVAKTAQNIHLPADYEETLRRSYSEAQARRYLDADFDVFEGQVFDMFSRATHVYDHTQVEIKPEWKRYRAIDHGLHNPTCCLWFAVDPEIPRVYCYREYYQDRRFLVKQNCQQILLRHGGDPPVAWTVIDPSVTRRDPENNKSVLNAYVENGIPCALGDNDRPAGLLAVMDALMPSDDGKPLWMISDECPHVVEDIVTATWDEDPDQVFSGSRKPLTEDIAQPGKFHALDAARYFWKLVPVFRHKAQTPNRAWWFPEPKRTSAMIHPVLGARA
jgi:hypothetical protein